MTDETGAQQAQTGSVPTAAAPSAVPNTRFFLPQGPPLPPKRWQRNWKPAIRIGSVIVALGILAGGATAVTVGVIGSLSFTATAAVEVDCASWSKPFAQGVTVGAPVRIMDADTGDVYATTALDKSRRMSSGVCLLGFEAEGVDKTNLYTVQIGPDYRTLVSYAALSSGGVILD